MDTSSLDTPRAERDTARAAAPSRIRQRGQALVIFAGSIVVFVGLLAIVLDVTWYWANTLKVQRAADAAALAGAVWLPDQPSKAVTTALASAKENGYTPGSGVTVSAAQNPSRDIQLDTTVSAPVQTFFMRLFGINSIQATRSSAAEYVLPVPMGSPLNYFGAFGDLRGWIHTNTGRALPYPDPGFLHPTATMAPNGGWTAVTNAFVDDGQYAWVSTTSPQGFGTFNLPIAYGVAQQFLDLGGIEVQVTGYSNKASGCQVRVDVTPDGGAHWYGGTTAPFAINESGPPGPSQTLDLSPKTLTFGGHLSTGATDTGDWFGRSNWTASDFTNAHFGVRVTPYGSGCQDYIDSVGVKVTYEAQSPPIVGPGGESLAQQGTWAGILSQGADVMNGDAYAPKYNNGASGNLNTQYSPTSYYDYAVELEPGTTDGTVYIFDPVFCGTQNDFSKGMGDNWYVSSGYGSDPMSTFFDVYDTNNTPYDLSDDTWMAGNSGPQGTSNPQYNLFRRSAGTDPDEGGPSVGPGMYDCRQGMVTSPSSGGYWHNRWWPAAVNLPGPTGTVPRVYRIHVVTTDPASPSDQNGTAALNNFSIFASVAGHTCPSTPYDPQCPRVYGLGSMVAFTPLNSGGTADLYLSQISRVYAGKTIKVSLWDPGDTNQLSATLSFLMPTSTGYAASGFTWSASRFSPGGSNCNGHSSGTVTSITTNTGYNNSKFNGCWLIIQISIPTTYGAPTPPGEVGPGWWKIRYQMGNQGDTASDLTTWKTQIIGNPVHLVVP